MEHERIKVDHVAKLARIELSEEERKTLETDLPAIVAYVDKLQEVDTSNVETREYLTDLQNQFRADEVNMDAQERERVIKAFPKKTGDALDVPAVFE